MKSRIARRTSRSTKVSDLFIAIQEEWELISADPILDLTTSVHQRVQDLLTNHGGHTSW